MSLAMLAMEDLLDSRRMTMDDLDLVRARGAGGLKEEKDPKPDPFLEGGKVGREPEK